MLKFAAAVFVFLGGFAIMVLEIIGARYLLKDFGGSVYVWISQIGVILVALAIGYAVGGVLADRFQRARFLALPLGAAALFTWFIPGFTPPLIDALVMRHPLDQEIPLVWQKLDPMIGSTLVFFLPCLVLATLSPYMIRLATGELRRVGTISGMIYAASTTGSVAGVFISGYVLTDIMNVSDIFRASGVLIFLLAGMSLLIDRFMIVRIEPAPVRTVENQTPENAS
jgi:MFS family permease